VVGYYAPEQRLGEHEEGGGLPASTLLSTAIHPSAWNRFSRKFSAAPTLCGRISYVGIKSVAIMCT
jgi:hypothetical protein